MSPHHIKNTQDFVDKIENIMVDASKILISYDVSALFTSIPVDGALEVVKHLIMLINDNSWKQRTYLSASQVLSLLEFYLRRTIYFSFQDGGCAKGSSGGLTSPVWTRTLSSPANRKWTIS